MLIALISLLLAPLVVAEVVEYDWVVTPRRSRPPLSPDCFTDRDMLLINDMNPGPVLRAKVGDTVRVKVTNRSPSESISIHYHGLTMLGQPYADGTGSRSQCVLGPLQTEINEFLIDQGDVGLHYWHGHTSMDRTDGLQGAIIIEPKDPTEGPEFDEERIIVLQDWFHRPGPSLRTGLDSVPFIWVGTPDTYLINGRALYPNCTVENVTNEYCMENCTDSFLDSIDVEAGKTYLLRVLNVGALMPINFAIANHSLTVVESDGTWVEPFTVDSLELGLAQRYSVLLTADQTPDSYWASASPRFRSGPSGLAYLSYSGMGPPAVDAPKPVPPEQDDVAPWAAFEAQLVTKDPSQYLTVEALSTEPVRQLIAVGAQNLAESGRIVWSINNCTQNFPATPTVFEAYRAVKEVGASLWPDTDVQLFVTMPDLPPLAYDYSISLEANNLSSAPDLIGETVVRFTKGDVVELILQNAPSLSGKVEYHAWHLHGHKFWVVGTGNGTFDPTTDPATYNLDNPIRRDTASLLPFGWTAVRFIANNPGAWPFHCTIVPHMIMGMGFTVVTSPDLLGSPPPGVTSCIQTSLSTADAQVCAPMSNSTSSATILASMVAPLVAILGLVLI